MKVTFLSKIFNPILRILPNEAKFLSKSHKLFLYYGLISPSSFGTFTIMPILQRSLDKLTNLVNTEMNNIGAEKLTMPTLGRSSIWQKSGRWSLMNEELYKLIDKDSNDLCLQPTHEEEVTSLLSSLSPITYKQMPILYYQITSKFRNETAPRSGLLRCREFLMKDLYSFDSDKEAAMITYRRVLQQYNRIFEQLDIDFSCVDAHCGGMGGDLSHEFHISSKVGEDVVMRCNECKRGFNRELNNQTSISSLSCNDPSCSGELVAHSAIEIGHCFLLSDRYSKVFNLKVKNENNQENFVIMGCYGIGITRLLAACVEYLSEKEKIRWPRKLAPYRVAVLLQKSGAKDQPSNDQKMSILEKLVKNFQDHSFCPSDILVDDSDVTIGRKLGLTDALGIPWAIVVKDKDVLETVDIYRNKTEHLLIDESIAAITADRFNDPTALGDESIKTIL